jgi:hypothetical protein
MSPHKEAREPIRPSATAVGLFRNLAGAQRAIRDLKDAGFTDAQIGVLMRDREEERRLAEDTGTKAGEAAAAGAVTGGVLGGLVGLLAGVGALVIPGIGPIIAGGALASTLAGAGIGAAAGGLVGALVGLGIPEEEARYYERGLQEGGILVTVDAGARAVEARRILGDAAAEFAATAPTSAVEGEGRERIELPDQELRARVRDPWKGKERRRRQDPSYAGPERRMVTT